MEKTIFIDTTQHGLGNRIRRLRIERGLSQYQFAKMIGMDRSFLISVEKGRRNVTLETITKIAAGLDVTLAYLFDGVDIEYQKH